MLTEDDSAAALPVALLDIQFLFAIQALGLLRPEHTNLCSEYSYGSRHWIIWNRTQHNVVAEIFGKDGLGTPSLAHRRRDRYLATARDHKSLCHGHYRIP